MKQCKAIDPCFITPLFTVTINLRKHESDFFQYIWLIISKLLFIICLLSFIGTVLKPSRDTKHHHPLRWQKTFRTYLHLGPLNREAATCQGVPAHSSTIELTISVQTVQIGVMTSIVPPAAFVTQGTVFTPPLVIITILGGKWHSTMITKRITSGTCKKERKRAPIKGSIFLY